MQGQRLVHDLVGVLELGSLGVDGAMPFQSLRKRLKSCRLPNVCDAIMSPALSWNRKLYAIPGSLRKVQYGLS